MRLAKIVSVCAASAMALALFDVPAAQAAKRSFSAGPSLSSRPSMAVRRTAPVRTVTKIKTPTKTFVSKKVITKKVVSKPVKIVKPAKVHVPKQVLKGPALSKKLVVAKPVKFVPGVKLGTAKIKALPIHKAVAGTSTFKARLAVPQSIKPKLSLIKPPKQAFQIKMAPFIQKQWKKPFFWVAVAGLGYITVPEFYYDRFVSYVNLYDPDYDECVKLLSYAALEDEEFYMVREPMPASATYRYKAKAPPPPVTKESVASPQEGGMACALTPFVERKWNRAYVWVQVPETGNVTVPEDYYDRFHAQVSGEPPNYTAACQVLVEAAAADMMASTSVEMNRTVYN